MGGFWRRIARANIPFGIPTREQNGQKYILHKQSTLAEGPQKTLDKVKKIKAKRIRQEDDLAPPTQLRPEAVKVMHDTSKKFVESSFNREYFLGCAAL